MLALFNTVRGLGACKKGGVAPIFAVCSVVLFGIAGMALDYGRAVRLRSKMQAAIDSATLAAANALEATRQEIGTRYFAANFSEAELRGVQVTFTEQSNGSVEGTVSGAVDTTLSRVLGINSLSINVSARAGEMGATTTTTSTTVVTPAPHVCILLLDPSISQSLLVNGGADVTTNGCEIHVKSAGSNAAVFNAGARVQSARICIESTSILDNGGTHPNTQTNCRTADDPFAGKLPIPSATTCNFSNLTFNGGNVALTPGVYCGWINFNAQPNVTLSPGLYIIKNGGWNVNGGQWSGTGVTFYFEDSSALQFNSAIMSNMSAPTSGTYDGILMFEKPGLSKSHFVFNDARGSGLTGLIHLPSRDMFFNSSSKAIGEQITMVFNTLILDQTHWDINPSSLKIPSGPDTTTTTTTTTTNPGRLALDR